MDKSISEFLGNRRTAKAAILTAAHLEKELSVSLKPDNSNVGTYSVVISDGKNSESFRMMYKGGQSLKECMEHFEEYLNLGKYQSKFTVTLTQNKERTVKEKCPLKEELKKLKAKRFKTYHDEVKIKTLEAQIKADPKKWNTGNGVGWKVTSNQINRGYQIIKVDYENKLALIKPIADTGITEDGTNKMPTTLETVHVAFLIRDKKYDAV